MSKFTDSFDKSRAASSARNQIYTILLENFGTKLPVTDTMLKIKDGKKTILFEERELPVRASREIKIGDLIDINEFMAQKDVPEYNIVKESKEHTKHYAVLVS